MALFKNSYWLRSGIYTLLQRLSNMMFGFVGFILLVRMMPKSDFGAWALFITVAALIEVARNGLVQNALIKHLVGCDEPDKKIVMESSFSLNFIVTFVSITFLLSCGGLLSAMWKTPQLQTLFMIYTFTTFCLLFLSQSNFIQQANLDFKGIFFSDLIRQGTFFSCIAYQYAVYKSISLEQLAMYQVIGAFLGAANSLFFVSRYFKISFGFHWERIKMQFNFGKYVFGTNISSMIFTSIDQVMLGILLPTSNVALFNAANRVTNYVEVPLSSVAQIVFPQSAKRVAEEGLQAACYLYERSVGLLLAMILPVVIFTMVFAKQIIFLLAGKSYSASIAILQIIVLATIFQPFVRQFGVALDSIGKPKLNFICILITSLINIGSNFFFISVFGLIGAAYGTLTTLFIFFIATQIILKRLLNSRFQNIFIHSYLIYRDSIKLILTSLNRRKKKGT